MDIFTYLEKKEYIPTLMHHCKEEKKTLLTAYFILSLVPVFLCSAKWALEAIFGCLFLITQN